jgi:hypothetical protein
VAPRTMLAAALSPIFPIEMIGPDDKILRFGMEHSPEKIRDSTRVCRG